MALVQAIPTKLTKQQLVLRDKTSHLVLQGRHPTSLLASLNLMVRLEGDQALSQTTRHRMMRVHLATVVQPLARQR
jgi:hypothetical protein